MKLTALIELLFSSKGRVNRKSFWLSCLGLMGVTFAVIFLGLAVVGHFDLSVLVATIVAIAPIILMAGCLIVISVKRLHDRNKTGWWLLLYYGFGFLKLAADRAALTVWPDEPSILVEINLDWVALIIVSIWYLIDLGFLRGTPGPNRFGSDPLAATTGAKLGGALHDVTFGATIPR